MLSLVLPFAQQIAPPTGLPAPQRPTTPPAATAPAPPPVATPYDQTWVQQIDIGAPRTLAATSHVVYVSGTSPHRDDDEGKTPPRYLLLARDLTDGHELWRLDVGTLSAFAADDERVVLGADGALRSVDPKTAAVQWTTPETGNPTSIVIRGGWVIASAGSALGAFRAGDGSVVWRQTLGPSVVGAPAVDGNALFVTLSDGRLMRLSILTGATEWTTWLDADSGPALAANTLVYVSLNDGNFVAYSQANGQYQWVYRFGAEAIDTAVSDTSHVYVALKNNTIQALDRDIGNQRWKVALVGRPSSGPLLGDDDVLLPSTDGEIVLAKRKDGATIGHIPPPDAPKNVSDTAPQLLDVAMAPGDVVLRLVSNSDAGVSLAAFHRKPKDVKK